MANGIGVSASTLSDIINGKRSCSLETAEKMARFFEMSPSERDKFLALTKLDAIKDPHLKQTLAETLKFRLAADLRSNFEQDLFEIISDWHHNAILTLLETQGSWDEKNISKKLGLNPLDTKVALSRLQSLGLISKNGSSYVAAVDYPIVDSKVPNSALRKYHRQMLAKAIEALDGQMPQEKVIRTETIAFDPKDLGKVDELIRECMNQIVALSKKSKEKRAVYHLSCQFFRLSK
jgi:uncharacterized protein (TIGR02147 family)